MATLEDFGLLQPEGPPIPAVPCIIQHPSNSPEEEPAEVPGSEKEQSSEDKIYPTISDRTIRIIDKKPIASFSRAWTLVQENLQRYPAVWLTSKPCRR